MTDNSKIKEFPDISSKLTAPAKKSQFERQKAEAEAKRAREKAETAAVYEDFVKSFDHDEDDDRPSRIESSGRLGGGGPGSLGPGGLGGLSKRHFTTPAGIGRTKGPGSLGPPPSSFTKKRTFDGEPAGRRDNTHGLFAFENSGQGPIDATTAFQTSDDEEEKLGDSKAMDKATAKPTLHLSSLPPGTSPAVIKSLIPSVLTVENVKILPQSGSATAERKSSSAIVTLAKDTPAMDIDTVVNGVQNKYLGWGFYLSISRYLSSAAVNAGIPVTGGAGLMTSLPFGARPIPQAGGSLSRAPPPGPHRGGFAPPSSYTPGFYNRTPAAQVTVTPPSDVKQLRLIHKTLESLLTYGPEFEALLMSRSDVQKEEKWSWIWNPRSPGGVWYRWRLWDILTDSQRNLRPGFNRNRGSAQVFEGGAAWVPPENGLKFEYTTQMEELVSDSDYNSSDEDSDNEGERRRQRDRQHFSGGPPDPLLDPTNNPEEHAYLNPLQKAKFTHLLARLPTSNGRLRKGDVARVTAFAIEHAGAGADEVVEMIVSNITHPYSYTAANPEYHPDESNNQARQKAEDDETTTPKDPTGPSSPDKERPKEVLDTSPSRLIALYLISDILSSSSTSGVRHAWRYRSLFEGSLKAHQTFAKLGRLEKEMRWGRLKAEKWKRSVMSVLALWEGWCVFPQESQDHFVEVFNKPPLTEREKREEEEENKKKAEEARRANKAGQSKWRAVDDIEEKSQRLDFSGDGVNADGGEMDVDGQAMDDGDNVDGEEMEDLDGEAMEGEDLDGVPMEEDEEDEMGDEEGGGAGETGGGESTDRPSAMDVEPKDGKVSVLEKLGGSPGVVRRRQRPKAEDMFADSDDE